MGRRTALAALRVSEPPERRRRKATPLLPCDVHYYPTDSLGMYTDPDDRARRSTGAPVGSLYTPAHSTRQRPHI